ncbi:ferric reductase-like transmembrane domain-containing protein [Schumannella sp. 10F1B-5-1]|uniref:ferric reductase-like transmembrane domain-containing protein n=1 Tax=Schumannella sp. 10F1B-5-1 TaxID=2590780 RepID=UPI002102CAE9|nr:ferric reductase-like transmembrane domain-containing protein [Schumannella sp. 10F1B-5-1]
MDEALWALGRATGAIGLLLMTGSVVLGILTRSGRPAAGLPRFGVAVLHRNVGVLATVFIGIHVVSLLFDPYAQLDLLDLVVPFLADYRPFWLGLGTVALDLAIAVTVTALLRNRIGPRGFKAVHWSAYALWPIAVAHGIGSGTDALTPWMLALTGMCIAAVVTALTWRVSARFRRPGAASSRPSPTSAPTTSPTLIGGPR